MQLESESLGVEGIPMTHPTRFMRNILADPGDDEPRLQYANWLDGCGNPLGEFIRLQCTFARTHAAPPSLYDERREQELLAKFRSVWSQSMTGCVEWGSFRRGFIEEVSLTDRQLIRNANELFHLAPVRDMHLKTDGRRLDNLLRVRNLRHTIFLDVSAQGLGDDGIARLAEAPLLEHVHGLNLGSCHLGDDGLEVLADSPHLEALRELYLNDNPITDDGVRQFVMSPIAERLNVLDMRSTRITDESVAILRHVLEWKVLV